MNYINALNTIFSQSRYQAVFTILLLVLIPVFTIITGLFLIATMEFNPIADPIRVVLMLINVLAIALNATIIIHNYEKRKTTAKSTTTLGTVAAMFTTSCSFCQPVWLFWLGLGEATAFLAEISVYITLISISFLLVSLHYSLKSVSNTCEVISAHGKNA